MMWLLKVQWATINECLEIQKKCFLVEHKESRDYFIPDDKKICESIYAKWKKNTACEFLFALVDSFETLHRCVVFEIFQA